MPEAPAASVVADDVSHYPVMAGSNEVAWQCPRIATRMVLEGGFLTEPRVIASCSIPGSDGRDVECVAVGKNESWLVEAATWQTQEITKPCPQ